MVKFRIILPKKYIVVCFVFDQKCISVFSTSNIPLKYIYKAGSIFLSTSSILARIIHRFCEVYRHLTTILWHSYLTCATKIEILRKF